MSEAADYRVAAEELEQMPFIENDARRAAVERAIALLRNTADLLDKYSERRT